MIAMLVLNLTSPKRYAAALLAGLLWATPVFATDENNSLPAASGTSQLASETTPAPATGEATESARLPQAGENSKTEETSPATQIGSSTSTEQQVAPMSETEQPALQTPASSSKIKTFNLQGNVLIDSVTIQQHLSNFLGLKKTSSNLFRIKQAVFKLYRSSKLAGVAVANPEYAADGTVLLKIFENDIKLDKALRADASKPEASEAEAQMQATETLMESPHSTEESTASQQTESGLPDIAKQPVQSQKNDPIAFIEKQQQPVAHQENHAQPKPDSAAVVKHADPSTMSEPMPAPPAWLANGWQQLEAGQTDAAMAIWQQEVNKMHGYRYLSFIGVYFSQETALNVLKRAGLEHHALMLLANRDGKPAYYVLSALRTSHDKDQRQLELSSLRKKMGIDHIYASAAKKFQNQPAARVTPVNKTEKKAEPELIKVETETAPASKPALKKTIAKKESRKAGVKKAISPAPAKEPEPQIIEAVITSDGKITAFNIYGNSLISDKIIQQQLRSYLGDNKTLSELLQARDKITQLYQGRGYPIVAVSMPEKIKGEIIPVRIYEVSGTKRALDK